jgi:mono/diheme cytochrome c family protein
MKVFASLTLLFFLGLTTTFSQTKPKAGATSGTLSASVNRGKLIYLQQCLSCHMMDGMGVPNMNPPLVKTTYVSGDKVRLIKIVLNGFTEKVDIIFKCDGPS